MKLLLILCLLCAPVSAQEFSTENLKKTLAHLAQRAQESAIAAEEAEKAMIQAQKERDTARGQVAEVVNANARLDSELMAQQRKADAIADELAKETDRANQAVRDLSDQKTATEAQRARALKWTLWCVIAWVVIAAWVVLKLVRLYLRSRLPIPV